MANLWPWLAVAGIGALHGLNPAGSLVLALAAVRLHLAAMLAVTAVLATVACHGVEVGTRWLRRSGRAA